MLSRMIYIHYILNFQHRPVWESTPRSINRLSDLASSLPTGYTAFIFLHTPEMILAPSAGASIGSWEEPESPITAKIFFSCC